MLSHQKNAAAAVSLAGLCILITLLSLANKTPAFIHRQQLKTMTKKKTCLWFPMHPLGLHISMKTMPFSTLLPRLLHCPTKSAETVLGKIIDATRTRSLLLLCLTTLQAHLSSISPITTMFLPTIKLLWRVTWITRRGSLPHLSREDLGLYQTTMVSCSLLYPGINIQITTGGHEGR